MIPAYVSKLNQVDELLVRVAKFGEDQFIISSVCNHVCVLLSGTLELALKETLSKFAKSKSHIEVANLAIAYLNGIQNPKPDRIEEIFLLLDKDRNKKLTEFWDSEIKDAIGSIVGNRHLIAHGRDTNISFVRINQWNRCCRKFCNYLQKEFE